MSAGPFDLEALIRAVIIALGVGLVMMAIAFFATREPEERRRRKPVLLSGTAGVIFIIAVAMYYAWPSLVIVPALDGQSQAQAEELLLHRRLVPNARPQYAVNVPKDTVIPKSQDPIAGLAVKAGTVVTFHCQRVQRRPAKRSGIRCRG
jgi:amino acid transporter